MEGQRDRRTPRRGSSGAARDGERRERWPGGERGRGGSSGGGRPRGGGAEGAIPPRGVVVERDRLTYVSGKSVRRFHIRRSSADSCQRSACVRPNKTSRTIRPNIPASFLSSTNRKGSCHTAWRRASQTVVSAKDQVTLYSNCAPCIVISNY